MCRGTIGSNGKFARTDIPRLKKMLVDQVIGEEGDARIRAAYGDAKYERLARLKRRFDPENLFRLNQNIPPAL
jgi:hypothetical protein